MAIAAPIDEISSGSMIEPDEEDDDPDRKADRTQRRRRQMRLLVERLLLGVGTRLLGLHQVEVLPQRPVVRSEN